MTFIEDMWCCLGSSKCFYIQVYLIENLKLQLAKQEWKRIDDSPRISS